MISKQDLCSLYQVSVQNLHERFPCKISWQDLCKRPHGKISVGGEVSWQDLLDKISVRDLLARSLYEISVPAFSKCSLGKIYARDLLARSLQQDLYAMSLYKVSIRGVVARSLYKISIRGLLARSL